MLLLVRFGLFFWVLFRLVSLIGRLNDRFDGLSRRFPQGEARYDVARTKNDPSRVRIGVELPDSFRFVLRRERDPDRVAKWLGIAEEYQTGEASFDALVYVLADDRSLANVLRSDADARRAVHALLSDELVSDLRANAGRLWISVDAGGMDASDPDAALAERVADRHLASLVAIRDRLAAAPAAPWDDERDPARRRERAFYVACVVALAAAFGAWLWSIGAGLPRPLSYANAETKALAAALVVTGLAGALAWYALDGTSRLHLVLIEVALSFIPATWLAARAIAIEYNMRADPAPRAAYAVTIVDRYVSSSGRRGRRYYVVVDGWPYADLNPRLNVRYDAWVRVARGCAVADVRPGRLGDPWLASLRTAECGSFVPGSTPDAWRRQ